MRSVNLAMPPPNDFERDCFDIVDGIESVVLESKRETHGNLNSRLDIPGKFDHRGIVRMGQASGSARLPSCFGTNAADLVAVGRLARRTDRESSGSSQNSKALVSHTIRALCGAERYVRGMVMVESRIMERLEFVSIPWQSELYSLAIDLRNRVLRLPLGLSFSDADIESERSQMHFGALHTSGLVGCVVLVAQPDGTAKLRQMAVEPNCQGTGVGKFLIQEVERVVIEQQISSINLHARKTAIGFYENLGYETQGNEFEEVTLPHVRMTKRLQRPGVAN